MRRYRNCDRAGARFLVFEHLEDRRLFAIDTLDLDINPTGYEQEFLQLVNRFRNDPAGEFARMFSSASPLTARDPSFQQFLASEYRRTTGGPLIPFSVDGNVLRATLAAMSSAEPLIWHDDLYGYVNTHNSSMINGNTLVHSNSAALQAALGSFGIVYDRWNELVSGGVGSQSQTYSVMPHYAGYLVEWPYNGYTQGLQGGMQSPASHRNALIDSRHDIVGSRTTLTTASNVRPYVSTTVLVAERNFPLVVTGAAFHDLDSNSAQLGYGWYENGEGLAGVDLVFTNLATGEVKQTRTLSEGGYQTELLPGTYSVKASGGELPAGGSIVQTIQVTDRSQWVNFIYRSGDITADASEPNNDVARSKVLSGASPVVNNQTLHQTRRDGMQSPIIDVDYFKYKASGTGDAVFRVDFTHSQGNIDLQLLDSSGTRVLGTSATNSNIETLTHRVENGLTYFVKVYGGPNGRYSLTVNGPTLSPPIAVDDVATASSDSRSIQIDVLANDTDSDGTQGGFVVNLASSSPAAFSWDPAIRKVRYTAPVGWAGWHGTTYSLADADGLASPRLGSIKVFVVNYAQAAPWQHPNQPNDVNSDGRVSPQDALQVINLLNDASHLRNLPVSGRPANHLTGFFDANGDYRISPIDALQIINELNAPSSGEGEPDPPNDGQDESSTPQTTSSANPTDLAFAQLMASGQFDEVNRRRQRVL